MRLKIPRKNYQQFSVEKARVIAHLMADGCVFKTNNDYVLKYEVTDEDMLKNFERDMLDVYGLPLFKGVNPSGKTKKLIPYVRLRSKLVYEDLIRYGSYYSKDWKIPSEVIESPQYQKREFAKSFFDDEGSIIKSVYSSEIRLYSINLKGLFQMQDLIKSLGVISTIKKGFGSYRNVYAIVITNIKMFAERIGFNSKRKKEKLRKLMEDRMLPSNPHPRI